MSAARYPFVPRTRAMAKRLALLISPIRSVYEQRNRLLSHVTALEAGLAELERSALKSTIVEPEARGVTSRTEINPLVGLAAEGQSLEQFNAKYGDVQGRRPTPTTWGASS